MNEPRDGCLYAKLDRRLQPDCEFDLHGFSVRYKDWCQRPRWVSTFAITQRISVRGDQYSLLPLLLFIGLMGVLMGISGCETTGRYSLAAPALKSVPEAKGDNNLEKVHDLVQDSQTKCAVFVDSMFANTAMNNSLLDFAGTLFSAAATAVNPIHTVHILTGFSTLASGTKTSISTNYLNGVTVSHITQAIQTTYSTDVAKYLAYLDTVKDPNGVDIYIERSRILSYHNECSLASADGSISSALQPGAPASAKTFALSVTYTLGPNETVQTIAQAIAAGINTDSNFKSAGITAVGSVSGTLGLVNMSVPQGQSVVWTTPFVFAPAKGKPAASESADFNPGPPPALKISISAATAQAGDSLTIRGTAQSGASTVAAVQSAAVAASAAAAAPPAAPGPVLAPGGTAAPATAPPGPAPAAATLGVAPSNK